MVTGHKLDMLRKLSGNLPQYLYITEYSYWDDLGLLAPNYERWEYDGCLTAKYGIEQRVRPRGKVVERQQVSLLRDPHAITLWGCPS
jgi:hypothetical protein